MRAPTFLILAIIGTVSANWFSSSQPDYTNWNTKQLESWLKEHNINAPKGYSQSELQELVKSNWDAYSSWTQERIDAAREAFGNVKESTFDAWDESKLRQFLLEQGVVSPNSNREQLALLAKQQYRSFSNNAASVTSKVASSASSVYQATSSVISESTDSLLSSMDDAKDYVFSTWDDSKLRAYLQEKGVVAKPKSTHEQLLEQVRETYLTSSDAVWEAWSDSFIREWLIAHGIVKSDYQAKRDKLNGLMKSYYYSTSDYVWDTWDDSTMKAWLVDHGIVKTEAQIRREKLEKMVADNYNSAVDTVWAGWKDSEIRAWLIDNGYLRSDAQVKRDEMVKLINEKYKAVYDRTADYLTWPDARLRAYLRSHGVSDTVLPTSRPDLLHEVRIRYIQTQNNIESMMSKIREAINSGVENVEDKLQTVLSMFGGAKKQASSKWDEAAKVADQKVKDAEDYANSVKSQAAKQSQKAKSEL